MSQSAKNLLTIINTLRSCLAYSPNEHQRNYLLRCIDEAQTKRSIPKETRLQLLELKKTL